MWLLYIEHQDNARQNTMKPGEQRKRGIKHVRPPSDLDWQVHQLLATRNDLLKQSYTGYKAKKDKKKQQMHSRLHLKMEPNMDAGGLASASSSARNGDETETWAGLQQHPLQHSLADSEDDDCDDGMAEDDDDCVDLVDLLTPVQPDHRAYQNRQQRQHQHQPRDALEPMTIIEEMIEPIKIEPSQDLTLDDDDDEDDDDDADAEPNDEYTFHPQQHSGTQMPNGCVGATEDTRDDRNEGLRTLQRDLLLLDIQLRQTQRQYENERMSHERQLFRKRTQLLDLQIRRAELEMRHVQRSNMHNQPEAPAAAIAAEPAAGNSADDQ